MEVKKIDDTQITNAIDLIWQTFLQFEAPDYSEEGVKSFQDFIENKEIIKTLEFWGAYDEEELKGVIATNENRKHICCFFVKAQYQRQGIGRKLWNFLRENSSSKTITAPIIGAPISRRSGIRTARTRLIPGCSTAGRPQGCSAWI